MSIYLSLFRELILSFNLNLLKHSLFIAASHKQEVQKWQAEVSRDLKGVLTWDTTGHDRCKQKSIHLQKQEVDVFLVTMGIDLATYRYRIGTRAFCSGSRRCGRGANGVCIPFAKLSVLIIAAALIVTLQLLRAGIEPNPGPEHDVVGSISGVEKMARTVLGALNKQREDTTRRWMIIVVDKTIYPSLMPKQVWNSITVQVISSRNELKHTPCYVICGDGQNVKFKAVNKFETLKLLNVIGTGNCTVMCEEERGVSLKQFVKRKSEKVTAPRQYEDIRYQNCAPIYSKVSLPIDNSCYTNRLHTPPQDQGSVPTQASDEAGSHLLALTNSSMDIPMHFRHSQREISSDNPASYPNQDESPMADNLPSTSMTLRNITRYNDTRQSYTPYMPSSATNTLEQLLGPTQRTSDTSRTNDNDMSFVNPNSQHSEVQSNIQPNPQLTRPRYTDYVEEFARFISFSNWPRRQPTPTILAKTGFFFTGKDDLVRCFQCGIGLKDFSSTDEPLKEHVQHSGKCAFLLQYFGGMDRLLQFKTFLPEAQSTNSASALTGAMANLSVDDSFVQRVIDANVDLITNAMGYSYDDFRESVVELRQQGNTNPSTEDIVTAIEIINERKEIASRQPDPLNRSTNESVFKENERLKSLLTCFQCQQNQVNALFLPCTHHKFCMNCAEEYTACPVCLRHIQQKIRTFMG